MTGNMSRYEPEPVIACLEVTGNIVITAMQSGKLPVEDANAVAQYFDIVYRQVHKSRWLGKAET